MLLSHLREAISPLLADAVPQVTLILLRIQADGLVFCCAMNSPLLMRTNRRRATARSLFFVQRNHTGTVRVGLAVAHCTCSSKQLCVFYRERDQVNILN